MEHTIVNKIIPFSSVDGPGNRTAIFFQSCNFNCLYCHNPETIKACIHCGICVEHCPVGALSKIAGKVIWNEEKCIQCDNCIKACPHLSTPKTKYLSTEDVFNIIMENRNFISGITVSGGECTLQEKFIVELFQKMKKEGLTCFVDSNGFKSFKLMKELTETMDQAMIDLKAYDKNQHIELTEQSNEMVLENIEYLASINKLYEIRTVIVPGILDNSYTVDMASKLLAKINPNIRYKLIKYRNLGVRTDIIDSYTPNDEEMESLKEIAESNGCKNIILI